MTDDEIIHHAIKILENRLHEPGYAFNSPEDAVRYLQLQYAGQEHESFRVMFLNNQHQLIQSEEMFRGTIDGASVYPREVVKATLGFNAAALIIAHNHPSGTCEPSQADKHITKKLTDALKLIDVPILDHIVVGDKETFSFAKHRLI